MSRADQSLRPTTPKTWSAKSPRRSGSPAASVADDEAELGLDVEAGLGPNVGPSVGALPLAAGPDDGGAAGTTVPPRPW
jgi:hypothetical protein